MQSTLFGLNLNEYRAPRVLCHSLTGVTEFPGKGMRVLQNFQKFRVRYGFLQNLQKFRVVWDRRTELAKVPSGYKPCYTRTPGIVATGVQNFQKYRGMNVVQNFQKFRVRV